MYREEASRQKHREQFSDSYIAFLKDCALTAHIRPLSADTVDRVYELAQRTNQMNFSGRRYSRQEVEQMIDSSSLDTFVIDCSDRFGKYGIVGFGLVERIAPLMTDLMFRGRVQGKRVDVWSTRFCAS